MPTKPTLHLLRQALANPEVPLAETVDNIEAAAVAGQISRPHQIHILFDDLHRQLTARTQPKHSQTILSYETNIAMLEKFNTLIEPFYTNAQNNNKARHTQMIVENKNFINKWCAGQEKLINGIGTL